MNTLNLIATILFLAFFALFCGGCATSPEFQAGAHVVGTDLATQAKRYATADTTADAATKAARQSQADALLAATATVKSITGQAVANAWASVRGWYLAYVDGDARLTPHERDLRHETANHLDTMILKESQRMFAAPP